MKTVTEEFVTLDATPADKLFETVNIGETLINLCIEYGRKLAMEDFIRVTKFSINKEEAMAILGMDGEESEDE